MKLVALALTCLALAACPVEPVDQAAALAVCARLADRCHPYEAVSLTAADCHRYAHANATSVCVAREAECLAACPSLPDAGASDAALPSARCAQLSTICHAGADPVAAACHELGHQNDGAVCEARYDDCLRACSPRDGAAD